MAQTSILLKNGTVLFHEKGDHVSPLKNTDVLIEGNIIRKISASIPATGPGTRTIDCTGKIVSPGFIDTHHHIWQTQLKGRFSDDTLLDYIPKGNLQSISYTPEDIFWGQLGGCLEAIDAGTTFVVDHAHMTYSPDHASEALSATAASGLRSFFCYNFTPRFKSWTTEIVPDKDLIPDWFMKQLGELAAKQPFGDGRVYLGWAFDLLFLPKEMVVPLYEQVRKLGIKLITTHVAKNAVFGMVYFLRSCKILLTQMKGQASFPNILESYGLLGPDILFSHGNGLDAEEAKLLKKHDIFISSTPDTESQMAVGEIGCFRDDMQASLGIDCKQISKPATRSVESTNC